MIESIVCVVAIIVLCWVGWWAECKHRGGRFIEHGHFVGQECVDYGSEENCPVCHERSDR